MNELFDLNNINYDELRQLSDCGFALRANVMNNGLLGSAANELRAYYALIALTCQGLKGKFTEAELGLLVWFNSGEARLGRLTVPMLPSRSNPGDQFEHYERQYGVTIETVGAKLAALTLVERFALADAITVYWHKIDFGEKVEIRELFDLDPGSLAMAQTRLIEIKSFVTGDSRWLTPYQTKWTFQSIGL